MALNKYMHPRNIYKSQKPNFQQLALKYDYFKEKVSVSLGGHVVLDFKDPSALRALTRAMLEEDFNLQVDLPLDRLIPTVPQRLNYVLWIEDIIGSQTPAYGVDIGTGASCIYPLLGCRRNGWKFLASDIDDQNLLFANENVKKNAFEDSIKVVKVLPTTMLQGLVEDDVSYDFCMCNPPFFSDHLEAQGISHCRSLDRPDPQSVSTASEGESIAWGGEVRFVIHMIEESLVLRERIRVYTSLLGKKSSIQLLKDYLQKKQISNYSTTEFCQGRTMRWGIAWSFLESVSFPKSAFKQMKNNDKPPITFIVPRTEGIVPDYTVQAYTKYIREALEHLKINYHVKHSGKFYTCFLIQAVENTWSHQRRRRREKQRSSDTSSSSSNTTSSSETMSAPNDSSFYTTTSSSNTIPSSETMSAPNAIPSSNTSSSSESMSGPVATSCLSTSSSSAEVRNQPSRECCAGSSQRMKDDQSQSTGHGTCDTFTAQGCLENRQDSSKEDNKNDASAEADMEIQELQDRTGVKRKHDELTPADDSVDKSVTIATLDRKTDKEGSPAMKKEKKDSAEDGENGTIALKSDDSNTSNINGNKDQFDSSIGKIADKSAAKDFQINPGNMEFINFKKQVDKSKAEFLQQQQRQNEEICGPAETNEDRGQIHSCVDEAEKSEEMPAIVLRKDVAKQFWEEVEARQKEQGSNKPAQPRSEFDKPDPFDESDQCLLLAKLVVRKDEGVISFILTYMQGNKEALHQILQYFKNRLGPEKKN